MVAIVDSGGANIASVRFALERLGVAAQLTSDPATIRKAGRVILPGVGAAGEGMKRLRERQLLDCVRELTQPVLGICLGMQLLFETSAEGETISLGLIPGRVAKLPESPGVTVPHMGWNTVAKRKPSLLLEALGPEARFYFVHSFAGPVNDNTVATSEHGVEFAAIVERGNFSGVQFHPERSGEAGARLLRNFIGGARPQAK